MAQQTAVEYLIEQLMERDFINKNYEIIEQAKAMEKEQMHECASFWRGKENEIEKPIFDEYYNKTYGNYQKLQ